MACCVLAMVPTLAQAPAVSLKMVHTNDTHSCVLPISKHAADTAQADKGGFLRRAALLRGLRADDPELLLFDSGDFSQGSAFYNIYKGEVEVKLMNEMGYDAATLGNHEFDFGLDNLARLIRMAKFPFVCANYKVEGTPLAGLVKPYVVIARKGLRIGVTGLGADPDGLVAKANYGALVYEDPVASLNAVARQLREVEHCDLVVCLSHLGWGIDGVDDTEVVPQLHGVDVVLGGHSHTYFEQPRVLTDADGHNVYCNQMGKNGRYVGLLVLDMQPAAQ